MLTGADEYPVHQTPEPIALVGNRNFYDRFFFNGFDPTNGLFLAAAMGIYPALDVIDGAFCVSIDGVQHNLRLSARLNGDRMAMRIGPLAINVARPLHDISLTLADNDSAIAAELRFAGRHFPVEEPRFTRRQGSRLFMDYTRMTQNGRWSGWVSVAGRRIDLSDAATGTRDRSWGIRPVGAVDAQPPPVAPQFFWMWTPCNFADHSVYCHTNDDAAGQPWNRRAVLAADGAEQADLHDCLAPSIAWDWQPDSRRLRGLRITLDDQSSLSLVPRSIGTSGVPWHFYMSGLGYTHPVWGHGMDHGAFALTHDQIDLCSISDVDPANLHIQAVADAELTIAGRTCHGHGVIEQMFIGPHALAGLSGLFDPHP